MSGGRFDYLDSQLKNAVFGHAREPDNSLEDMEISDLVWDVFELLHEFDYYKSGDSDREDYVKAKAAFKEKWFGTDTNKRRKSYIDKSVNQLRQELYETFGIDTEGESTI